MQICYSKRIMRVLLHPVAAVTIFKRRRNEKNLHIFTLRGNQCGCRDIVVKSAPDQERLQFSHSAHYKQINDINSQLQRYLIIRRN